MKPVHGFFGRVERSFVACVARPLVWIRQNPCPAIILACLLMLLASIDDIFERTKFRSIVVDARTQGLEVVFKQAATLPLGDASICRPRAPDDPNLMASEVIEQGCAFGFNTLVRLQEFSLVFPPGSAVGMHLNGDQLQLKVLRTGLEGAPQVSGVRSGDVVLIPVQRFKDLPKLTAYGSMHLGVDSESGADGSLLSGTYSFRFEPLLLRWTDSNRMLLSGEPVPLYSGARFRVVRADADDQITDAPMNIRIGLNLSADGSANALHVVGISEFGRVKTVVEYIGAEPAFDWPHWTLIFINDPVVLLLATIGAILGIGSSFGVVRRVRR